MGLLTSNPSTPPFEEQDSDWDDKPATTTARQPAPAATQTRQPTQRAPMTQTTSAVPTTRVVTGEIRGSYVKIFKPELGKNAKEGDVPKCSMTLLIRKDDKATLDKIAAAQEAAIAIKFPVKRPPKLESTLHDGDLPRPSNGEDFGPECKGHMVMTVASKFKPKILDLDGNEILDASQVGSGDYFKVSLNAYGYDFSGKRGTSFGLNNVLFVRKGISLGGQTSAEDDFAEDLKGQ